jgi:hypothetical protein
MNSHCATILGATILPSFRSRKLHGEVLPRCFWDAMTRAWLGNGWEMPQTWRFQWDNFYKWVLFYGDISINGVLNGKTPINGGCSGRTFKAGKIIYK